MSKNIFLASDLHISHVGITKFLRSDGSKVRPWDNIEDMNESLIENWNKVVRPEDRVYNLGDVVINRKALPILARLNGEKILVKGNHDVFRLEEYAPYFKDLKGSAELSNFLLTHIPVHPREIGRWKGNFHGHLHSEVVTQTVYDPKFHYERQEVDPRYLCVSMEQINYTPISLEDAKKKWEAQQ